MKKKGDFPMLTDEMIEALKEYYLAQRPRKKNGRSSGDVPEPSWWDK